MFLVQGNLANDYEKLGHIEKALRIKRDVYSGRLNLLGEEDRETFIAANNYANALIGMQRFEEAKLLMRKMIPVARRLLGESDQYTLTMRVNYAMALWRDDSATLDDLREAVTTLEDTARIARQVFGGANPFTSTIEVSLKVSRAVLGARETPPGSSKGSN